jgi:hypothetical protein
LQSLISGFFSGGETVSFFDVKVLKDVNIKLPRPQDYSMLRNGSPLNPRVNGSESRYQSPPLSSSFGGANEALISVLVSKQQLAATFGPQNTDPNSGIRLAVNQGAFYSDSNSIVLDIQRSKVVLSVRSTIIAQIPNPNTVSREEPKSCVLPRECRGFFAQIKVNSTKGSERSIIDIKALKVSGLDLPALPVFNRILTAGFKISGENVTLSATSEYRIPVIESQDLFFVGDAANLTTHTQLGIRPSIFLNTGNSVDGYRMALVCAKEIVNLPILPSPSPSPSPASSPSAMPTSSFDGWPSIFNTTGHRDQLKERDDISFKPTRFADYIINGT